MTLTLADPYLSQNEGRRYPLADDSVGLQDASLVDFRATVRNVPDGRSPAATVAALNTVEVEGRTFRRLSVLLSAGARELAVLAFDIPGDLATGSPFTAYARTATACGALTVTVVVLDEADGPYNVPFAPTTVRADDLKVDSVQSAGSVESTDPSITHNPTTRLTGRLVLTEGFNTEPYLDGNRLRLNVAKKGGIGEWCQTADAGQTCGNVLFTINGERPGSDGDLRLTGESGVRVTPLPDEHALRIELDDVAQEKMFTTCEKAC